MTQKLFKAAGNNAGDDWLLCWTGQDNKGEHWNVVTDHMHGSKAIEYLQGAKQDAELIARLMNWYYSDEDAAREVLEKAESAGQE